jgi:hypothetical protein
MQDLSQKLVALIILTYYIQLRSYIEDTAGPKVQKEKFLPLQSQHIAGLQVYTAYKRHFHLQWSIQSDHFNGGLFYKKSSYTERYYDAK